MNPMPELNTQLKQLRLSGFLESLETRNRQAIDGHLAYTEFLALLVGDEVARRDNKKLNTRLRRASFRAEKTLAQFDFDRLPQVNRGQIQDLAAGSYIREKVSVLIAGPVGTGKSHLAQALGHCAVQQGHDVLFASQTQLLAGLHAARATGAYERRLQYLSNVEVLIVDDFALKPLRAPHDEDFHELIAERYERAPTIVTSNLDFDEWPDAFPANRMLGAATLDRLRHGAYRIVLDGASYRAPKPMTSAARERRANASKTAAA
jgi:DNA replication protein DnaC